MEKKIGRKSRIIAIALFAVFSMLLFSFQVIFAGQEGDGLMVVDHKVKTGHSQRSLKGYIDSSGSLKFGGFQRAEDFSEGLAWVLPDEKDNFNNYGVIDTSGKLVIAPQNFSNFKPFSCGLARVDLRSENGYHFIDRSGKLVLKGYSSAESFSFDRALVKKDNQEFFIDKAGNRLFQDKNYRYMESFSDGLAVVSINDNKEFDSSTPSYGFIDTNGELAIDLRKSGIRDYYTPQRFSEGLAALKYKVKDSVYGVLFINKSGKVAFDIGERFSEAYPFTDGMAMVKERSTEKWGYVNTSGEIVLPPVYSKNIDFFHEGRALVAMHETPTRFGYIDKTGKFIYGPEEGSYSSLGRKEWLFHESSCRFKGGMASYIGKVINLNGQIIWPHDKATTAQNANTQQSSSKSAIEVQPSEMTAQPPAPPSPPQKALPKIQPSSSLSPDLVGAGEGFQPDGTPDTKVYVSVSLTNARLQSMSFRNTDGAFALWDTVPGNGMWLLGVNMLQDSGDYVNLNNADGSLQQIDVSGEVLFELRLHDSGVIAGRQNSFQLEIELADGQKIVKNVAAGELGNVPQSSDGISNSTGSAANNAAGAPFKIVSAAFRPPSSAVNSVGPYEEIRPGNEPDSLLTVEFFAEGKTLVNAEVRNTDGAFSVWDTIPNNGMWGLGVFVTNNQGKGRVQQNNPDSSLKPYQVTKAPDEIELRMTDAGSIRDKSTSFMVILSFSDGTSLTYNIGKPQY